VVDLDALEPDRVVVDDLERPVVDEDVVVIDQTPPARLEEVDVRRLLGSVARIRGLDLVLASEIPCLHEPLPGEVGEARLPERGDDVLARSHPAPVAE
jgi:hypothetical protein